MESTDLKSQPSDDDRVAALLRADMTDPILDNGFSARVLLALPAPQHSLGWRTIATGVAAVAAAAAFASGPEAASIASWAAQLPKAVADSLPSAIDPWSAATAMVAISATVIFWPRDESAGSLF